MKRFICIVLLVSCLTSCGKYEQEDFGDTYVPDKDAQTFSGLLDSVYTEQGFYTIADHERIDFVDRKTGVQVPMCAKPNCRHEDASCSAYFTNPQMLQAYDGMLYVVASSTEKSEFSTVSLYRCSMDGSERVELKTLYSYEDEDNEGVTFDFVIHRGYGYMVVNWVQKDREERTQTLYRISLDGNEEKEKIYEIKGYAPLLFITQGEKNRLYFLTNRFLDKDEKEYEICNFYLDILEGTVTKVNVPDGYSIIAAKNGKVYYYTNGGSDANVLYCMNEDGTDQRTLFEWEYSHLCFFNDSNYIYVDNDMCVDEDGTDPEYKERKVVVLDYDGNVIRELTDLGLKVLQCSNGEQLLLRIVRSGSDETTYELEDVRK